MSKTLYEGYRVGKDGGGRWTGTIQRAGNASRVVEAKPHSRGAPKGGSAFHNAATKPAPKEK